MKKKYRKPEIFIESFEVSEFIAGSCTIDVNFGDTGAINPCAYPDPDFGGAMTIFNSLSVCDSLWDDEENNDKGCYHIPVDGAGYFGS